MSSYIVCFFLIVFVLLFKVRVCDGCYAQLQRPTTAKTNTTRTSESDLPAEYLNSSLAQQVQVRIFSKNIIVDILFTLYIVFGYYCFDLDPTP